MAFDVRSIEPRLRLREAALSASRHPLAKARAGYEVVVAIGAHGDHGGGALGQGGVDGDGIGRTGVIDEDAQSLCVALHVGAEVASQARRPA